MGTSLLHVHKGMGYMTRLSYGRGFAEPRCTVSSQGVISPAVPALGNFSSTQGVLPTLHNSLCSFDSECLFKLFLSKQLSKQLWVVCMQSFPFSHPQGRHAWCIPVPVQLSSDSHQTSPLTAEGRVNVFLMCLLRALCALNNYYQNGTCRRSFILFLQSYICFLSLTLPWFSQWL